jgi:putative membrane protein
VYPELRSLDRTVTISINSDGDEKNEMLSFFLTWVVAAVSLVVTANIVPGITVVSFPAAMLAAVVIGFVNAVVRPIITLLTLPLSILTLGLFLFVVNAISLSLASWLAGAFSIGFVVNGFWPALFGSIVLSFISGFIGRFVNLDSSAA